jgi:aryl-alcohol dehydrogenase-like predicted oxidoreductase
MGGGAISREDDDALVFSLLDAYRGLGGNFFDSANIYGKWLPSGRNACDANIGRWLRRAGGRDGLIIATKAAHPPLADMSHSRLGRGDLEADIDESLLALGCGAIDLLYLHRDDPSVPVEAIVDDLNDFVKMGKIRYFAASNWTPARIAEAQAYAAKSGKMGFAANQVRWSYAVCDKDSFDIPLTETMDEAALHYHRESGLAAIAYESQARGFFQKYAAAGAAPPALAKAYGAPANAGRFERASRLARELGAKVGDVALGYVLNQPFATVAIIGGRTVEQLRDSATAADLRLTAEQIAYLRADG